MRTEGTEDTDDEDEDEEPRLKYSRLTGNLASCYRSDSTSSFLVAGDKMVWLAAYCTVERGDADAADRLWDRITATS